MSSVSFLTSAVALVAGAVVAGVWSRSHLARLRVRHRLYVPPSRQPAPFSPAIPSCARRLRGQDGEWATEQVVGVGVGAGLALAALVSVMGPIGLALAAVAGAAAPAVLRQRRRAERRRLRRTQLPAALDRLATALRGGSSVPMALAEAGAATPPPLGPELLALGRQANAGQAVADVLDGWSAQHDDAGTRLAATALTLATAVGGAPGHAVDGAAATLRERVDLADERRALASQARLSALVLAAAPVGFAALLGATDGRAASFLLRTPAGWLCLVLGLALDAAGVWWMTRLTRGTEP
jgi:tight adherence protein B